MSKEFPVILAREFARRRLILLWVLEVGRSFWRRSGENPGYFPGSTGIGQYGAHGLADCEVVAGEGFEPPTLGL
jgi:hypothetical protein